MLGAAWGACRSRPLRVAGRNFTIAAAGEAVPNPAVGAAVLILIIDHSWTRRPEAGAPWHHGTGIKYHDRHTCTCTRSMKKKKGRSEITPDPGGHRPQQPCAQGRTRAKQDQAQASGVTDMHTVSYVDIAGPFTLPFTFTRVVCQEPACL